MWFSAERDPEAGQESWIGKPSSKRFNVAVVTKTRPRPLGSSPGADHGMRDAWGASAFRV